MDLRDIIEEGPPTPHTLGKDSKIFIYTSICIGESVNDSKNPVTTI